MDCSPWGHKQSETAQWQDNSHTNSPYDEKKAFDITINTVIKCDTVKTANKKNLQVSIELHLLGQMLEPVDHKDFTFKHTPRTGN